MHHYVARNVREREKIKLVEIRMDLTCFYWQQTFNNHPEDIDPGSIDVYFLLMKENHPHFL